VNGIDRMQSPWLVIVGAVPWVVSEDGCFKLDVRFIGAKIESSR
jgi:hypothetical protein